MLNIIIYSSFLVFYISKLYLLLYIERSKKNQDEQDTHKPLAQEGVVYPILQTFYSSSVFGSLKGSCNNFRASFSGLKSFFSDFSMISSAI